MKLRFLLVPLAAFAVLGAFAGSTAAQDGPPGPSAGTVIVNDLIGPRGMAIGPDGLIYIAEAGSGGDTEFVTEDGATVMNGFTGRISVIDPATGERTTIADGLPSQRTEMGDQVGPADVAFIDDQLYYVQTHGGEYYGFPDNPTGIYAVDQDAGTVELVVNIGEFNIENPVEAITSGEQADIEVGGNPYSMITRDGVFYVSDGNHNRLIEATPDGDASQLVEFPNHPVSTGIAETESGPFYVGYLGRGPFLPADGKVVSVDPDTAEITEIASGEAMISDAGVGPDGTIYALQFAENFEPFTGSVLRVEDDGTFTTLVTGLTFATDMIFIDDTLYVTNDGLSALGPGELVEIENFSSVEPPAPTPTTAPVAPTATPTSGTGVTAPDTGSGGYTDNSAGASTIVLALALAVAVAAATGGAALALKRR